MQFDNEYPYYVGGPPVQGPFPAVGPQSVPGPGMGYGMPVPLGVYYPPWPPSWPANPGPHPQQFSARETTSPGFLGLGDGRFLKGVLIGAGITLLLTNEGVQRSAIRSVVKVWTTVYGGFEEIKERFRDAEAELRAAEEPAQPK